MIESRASNVPIDKGNCIRDYMNPRHHGSSDEIIVEHVVAVSASSATPSWFWSIDDKVG